MKMNRYVLVYLAMVIGAIVGMVGCTQKTEPQPTSGAVTVPPPTAQIEDLAQKVSFDETLRVNSLKRAFVPATEYRGVERLGPEQWNDVLCDAYLRPVEMASAKRIASEDDWQKAGVSKTFADAMHQEAALAFNSEIQKLLALSTTRRLELEKEWSHTCDGMLSPTDTVGLVDKLTHILTESGATRPTMTPRFRTLMLDIYKGRAENESFGGERLAGLLKEAEYWGFTSKQIGIPVEFPGAVGNDFPPNR